MTYQPKTSIGRYEIISVLGKGGMGEVYLAEDTDLDRKVAIKFLNEDFSQDSDKLNRFIQEAKAASALNHPNIITIYEIGEFKDTHFIAAEHIDGKTLTEKLRNETLELGLSLDIAIQIASALDEAHKAGIVHRDIKPDNVMIRSNGLVKILDFGIAKLTENGRGDTETQEAGEDDETLISQTPKTIPGMIIGTANYMSPEQAKGKEVDARTDIFSFGMVLYEMVAGCLPFEGETAMEIIGAIIHKKPKPLENVHPDLEEIIAKTLEKNRNARYQDSKELLEDLQTLKKRIEFEAELEHTSSPDKKTEAETILIEPKTIDEEKNRTMASEVKKKRLKDTTRRDWQIAGVISLLIVVFGILGYYLTADSSDKIESIAVMPFVNESGSEDIEYLSDGMTETLISSLSNIPNLSVKARSSVFRYKGKQTEPKKIGVELDVQAVLLGRVIQRGENLALNLELVDVATENVLWAEKFDRKMSDLVSLQSEIARDVSNKLRVKLTSKEIEQIAKTYTADSEAQKLYLKGRFHWNKRNEKDFRKAIEYFKQAIEKDPGYALAYSGLADSYTLLTAYSDAKPEEYLPLAKKAALKALELDDTLAETQSSLGHILWYYDYKWTDAEKRYRRAIELDPDYADAHQWLAELQSQSGKHEQALKTIKRALELEPLSLIINRVYADILINARRTDEGIIQYKKTLELDPYFSSARQGLANIYFEKGMYDEAFALWEQDESDPEEIKNLSDERERIKKIGVKASERLRLEQMIKANARSYFIALLSAELGEKDKTLEYLNKAYRERDHSLNKLKVEPAFDFMRDDPRFKELIKKVGIPD